MSSLLRTLLVEDSESDCLLIVRQLTKAGFPIQHRRVETAAELEAALRGDVWDLIICDYNLPQFNAHAALKLAKDTGIDVPFIVISGSIGEEIAVSMMREGAHDYLLKDNLVRLGPAVEREIREAHSRADHHMALEALRQSEEQLRLSAQVFENSGEGILITDAECRIVSVNNAFTKITGYFPREVIGQDPRLLGSGRHDAAFFTSMWQDITSHGYWQGEIWNRRKNGEVFAEWLGITMVRGSDGGPVHYLGIFADMTERKEAEQRINYLAHHDALTGLPNRALFRRRFEEAAANPARNGTCVALLYLNIDRFKIINASLGYPAGDRIVYGMSERLKEFLGDATALCRQGGDEFLLLKGTLEDAGGAGAVASDLIRALSVPIPYDGNQVSISASLGISVYPDDGSDFETLFTKADSALSHAKESGRNTYRFFTETLNANFSERIDLEQRLRKAVEKNLLLLYYQPQISLTSGQVVGAEALLRWKDPEKGMIAPDKFIPIAEASGLIVPLGEWVLREACRVASIWHQSGVPITIGVNLSALQFKRSDLVETVYRALKESGLPAPALELELTESMLIQDAEETLEKVQRLRAMGVRFSIDDFGTGYSSLIYLKRFPFDRLKIDRSFTTDVTQNADAAAIARAIIQMGKSLRLIIVAEGIEDQAQLDLLKREGCDEAQGYFFGKAISGEEFIETHIKPMAAEAI